MGTLGVIAVGLLGLVLLLVRRRNAAAKRRRPTPPRTVADLVNIRESQGRIHTDPAAVTPAPSAVTPAASIPAPSSTAAHPTSAETSSHQPTSTVPAVEVDPPGGSAASAESASEDDPLPVGQPGADVPPSGASVEGLVPSPRPRPSVASPTATGSTSSDERIDAAPAVVAPVAVDPAVVDPVTVEPAAVAPVGDGPTVDDAAAGVASVDGTATEASPVDPAAPDVPVAAPPDPVAQTVSAPTVSAPTQSGPTQNSPTPSSSTPSSSTPSSPTPSAPTPISPTPALPGPVVPAQRGRAAASPVEAAGPLRAGGRRRSGSGDAAEPIPVDLDLLRTFGVAGPGSGPEPDDEGMALSVRRHEAPPDDTGRAAPVAFRVVGRDGSGVADATVTLHDGRGRETASAPSDEAGQGALSVPRPGSYVLVTAAQGFQPGATALTVGEEVAHVEILLTRGASIGGTVRGGTGPGVAVRVALVQDGETVDAVRTGQDGGYCFGGLTAGRYGVSVTAGDRPPVAVLVPLTDEQQTRCDVDLGPVDLPRHDVVTSGC